MNMILTKQKITFFFTFSFCTKNFDLKLKPLSAVQRFSTSGSLISKTLKSFKMQPNR